MRLRQIPVIDVSPLINPGDRGTLANPCTRDKGSVRSALPAAPDFFSQIKSEFPPHYAEFYLSYNRLKTRLHSQCRLMGRGVDRYNAVLLFFRTEYQNEIDKINKFVMAKSIDIWKALKSIRDTMDDVKKRKGFLGFNTEGYRSIVEDLYRHKAEIIHIDRYIRINLKIAVRIIRVAQTMVGRKADGIFAKTPFDFGFLEASLENEPFVSLNVDAFLLLYGYVWDVLRNANNTLVDSNTSTWQAPSAFVRSTAKYWVPADRLVDCKAFIVEHTPTLVYGRNTQEVVDYIESVAPTDLFDRNNEPIDTQRITSVYLDNHNCEVYKSRITRMEGATLIRYRWYGSNDCSNDKVIFVERKTHHENWTNTPSRKERFPMKQGYVPDFISCATSHLFEVLSENSEHDKKLAQDVLKEQQTRQLQPMIRTTYQRSAYQVAENNNVRFSIDTNLCFVDELNHRETGFWCRLADKDVEPEAIARFPWAILEVKLQVDQPLWVSEMLLACGAIGIHKFSKFQHAVAVLHGSRLNHSYLPHWLSDFMDKAWCVNNDHPAASDSREYNQNLLIRSAMGDAFSSRSIFCNTGANNSGMLSNASGMYSTRFVSRIESQYQSGYSTYRPAFESYYSGRRFSIDSQSRVDKDRTLDWYARYISNLPKVVPLKDVKVIDPKPVLASERVYLTYMKKAMIFVVGALGLLTRGLVTCGVTVMFVAMVIMLYGWVLHLKRVTLIMRESYKKLPDDAQPSIHSTQAPKFLLVVICLVFLIKVFYSGRQINHMYYD